MVRSFSKVSLSFEQKGRRAALAFALMLALPASALAVPVDVFFQGTRLASEPETAFGIGASQAANARDNFGIEIVGGATGDTIVGTLGISQAQPTGFSATPGTDTFNRASSDWTLENVSGSALTGANYLVFTHTDPFTVDSTSVDYVDENVGITIDADDGWSILQLNVDGNDFYYPALLLDTSIPNPLDGNIAPGASITAEINYAVNAPLIEIGAGTNVFSLPEFEVAFATVTTVVPEPGTALLLTIGLIGLASVQRKD